MFDTLLLLAPALPPLPELTVRQHQTAFGPDERRQLWFHDTQFGTVSIARDAFTWPERITSAPDRENWTVVNLARTANDACRSADRWKLFAASSRVLLDALGTWAVRCESDCDQHPIERVELTPVQLLARLESLIATRPGRFAFHAECPLVSPTV